MTLVLLPAVDVAGGRAVRRVPGGVGTETADDGPTLEGAIVGRALYAGRFTLREALDAVERIEPSSASR